jgi:hypothetical protein
MKTDGLFMNTKYYERLGTERHFNNEISASWVPGEEEQRSDSDKEGCEAILKAVSTLLIINGRTEFTYPQGKATTIRSSHLFHEVAIVRKQLSH